MTGEITTVQALSLGIRILQSLQDVPKISACQFSV